MVGFKISGVVRAARRAHERVRQGIPADERAAFLSRLATTVAHVEALCAKNGATPRDLPAPSRRALADLQALARLAPGALPAPRDGVQTRRSLAISNVVSTLDWTLEHLSEVRMEGLGVSDEEEESDVAHALSSARRCVEAVERICREKGASPAALPARTGAAYAFLRWLLDEDNLALYLDRRDAAASAFATALHANRDTHPRWWGLRPSVSFRPGRSAYRLKPVDGALDCRLGVGWLGAGDDDLTTLAIVTVQRGDAPSEQVEAHRAFLDSEDFGALHHELDAYRDGKSHQPQGRVRNLEVLFDRLNARFFRGSLVRPRLSWHAGASLGRFGCYLASRDHVDIDVRLDDERVPEFVAEFVLYHELLHKIHGARMRGHRRYVHTPEFRVDERRFPRWEEAEAWLSRIVREAAEGNGAAGAPPRGDRRVPASGAARSQEPAALPAPGRLRSAKVPRNAPCPCGSGHKYKKCCLGSAPPTA